MLKIVRHPHRSTEGKLPVIRAGQRVLMRLLASAMLWLAGSVQAQVSTANVTGVVEDGTGARIRSALVKLINTQTGAENDCETSRYGGFLLPGVFPGTYVLQIARSGFRTLQIAGLTLNVGETKDLLIRMQVGSILQTVTVNGSGLALNTVDGTMSTIVDRTFVANIPLDGRSFQDLISMTPGVLTQTPQNFTGMGASHGDFSVDGERPEANSYSVDGVSADIGIGSLAGHEKVASAGDLPGTTAIGTTQSLASVDALQEFRVLSSSYSAEYGGGPGGQFSLLTRAGTSAFHGAFFDYFRNFEADAADWFIRYYPGFLRYQYFAMPFHQNDFGGTLGFPLSLPGIDHGLSRTFLFFSYEGLQVEQPTGLFVQFVPSSEMFTEAPPALEPILPLLAYNTTSLRLAVPHLGLSAAGENPTPYPDSVDAVAVRLDHTFTRGSSAFIRYSNTPSNSQSASLASLTLNSVHTQTLTAGWTAQISSAIANDLRAGYATTHSLLQTQTIGYLIYDGFEKFPLNALLGAASGSSSESSDFFLQIAGAGSSEVNTDEASGSLDEWNLRDTIAYQREHHLLQFGLDVRHLLSTVDPPSLTIEADYFNEPSILQNLASDISITKAEKATPVFNEFAGFVEDEWHVSREVTLSPGVRWEVNPPPHGREGNDAYALRGDVASPASLQLAPRGSPLWKTNWLNFAPRFGVAWSADRHPGRELVLRAGGGVFFETDNRAAMGAFSALGFSATSHLENVPVPVTTAQLDFSAAPAAPYTASPVFDFPQHLQLPFVLQWNGSVEKAFGKDQALTASWVGAAGRRLLLERRTNVSAGNPEFGEVISFPNGITSNYQALQVKFQRSISPGVQALADWTWSHALDYGSTDPAWPLTRSNSEFDVRQNLEAAVSWTERKLSGNWLRRGVLGGWGADGLLSLRTAFPVTPLGTIYSDPATGNRYYSGDDLIPGRPLYLYGSKYPGGRMFNGGPNAANPAFVLPAPGSAGDAPRNKLRGFGEQQINIDFRKEIAIRGRLGLELRGEAYNLFNHPDFGYMNAVTTDFLFGQAALMLNQSFGSTSSLYEPGGPRSIQIDARLRF